MRIESGGGGNNNVVGARRYVRVNAFGPDDNPFARKWPIPAMKIYILLLLIQNEMKIIFVWICKIKYVF